MTGSLFRSVRWMRNQVIRFWHLSPLQVLADYRRAARLERGQALAVTPVPKGPERVVVSLTTIPARLGQILPTLLSLLEQTRAPDRLILALPVRSLRDGIPYPAPLDLPPGIDVLQCLDYGPSTKLLPALRAEPEALIIALDDDVIYPRDYIQTLLEAHRRWPGAALGWRGWQIEEGVPPRLFRHVWASALRRAQPVDILLGWGGYLVPPGALGPEVFDYDGWPAQMRWVDDVWISGHLARRGVQRLVVPGRSYPVARTVSRQAGLSDGINLSDENNRIALAAMAHVWRNGGAGG